MRTGLEPVDVSPIPLDISILPRPSQTRSEPFHEKPVLIRFQAVERVFERLQHDWIHNVVQPTREHKYDQHLQLHQAELMHA